MSNLAILVVAGYVVGLPLLVRGLTDLRRFHRPLWVGYGKRELWRNGMIVTYVVGGWPVLVMVLLWWTGPTRRELNGERERMRGQ